MSSLSRYVFSDKRSAFRPVFPRDIWWRSCWDLHSEAFFLNPLELERKASELIWLCQLNDETSLLPFDTYAWFKNLRNNYIPSFLPIHQLGSAYMDTRVERTKDDEANLKPNQMGPSSRRISASLALQVMECCEDLLQDVLMEPIKTTRTADFLANLFWWVEAVVYRHQKGLDPG